MRSIEDLQGLSGVLLRARLLAVHAPAVHEVRIVYAVNQYYVMVFPP